MNFCIMRTIQASILSTSQNLRTSQHFAYKSAFCVQVSISRTSLHFAYKSAFCVQVSISRTSQYFAYKSAFRVQVSILHANQCDQVNKLLFQRKLKNVPNIIIVIWKSRRSLRIFDNQMMIEFSLYCRLSDWHPKNAKLITFQTFPLTVSV